MNSLNRVISLNVSDLGYQETLNRIIELGSKNTPSYCCFANVHMTIEAKDDANFAKVVNSADIVCADGMPLVKAVNTLYNKKIDRVAGMDMMPSVMKKAEQLGLSVFFFGGTEDVLEKITEESNHHFPKLKIAGTFSPPFKQLSIKEKQAHVDLINKSGANIVMVALGCPKQEKWMADNTKKINAVLLGVGGAFPVFAKTQKRAPEWIRKISMEWVYRFIQDPKRLFKRYFYTNSKFIILILKQYFNR